MNSNLENPQKLCKSSFLSKVLDNFKIHNTCRGCLISSKCSKEHFNFKRYIKEFSINPCVSEERYVIEKGKIQMKRQQMFKKGKRYRIELFIDIIT